MAQYPPPGSGVPDPYGAPGPYAAPPPLPAADRVRMAWQHRYETDYIFSFWTALGWSILTCGFYSIYVIYQLMRRSRDHNRRRLELLDAAMTYAWEQAHAKGITEHVRPAFERMAPQMAVLRNQTTEFRDPAIWALLALIGSLVGGLVVFGGIVVPIVAFILLDMDLVAHDHAEGAIEAELSQVYAELGTPVSAPDPGRLKGRHNYVGRVIATLASCSIYGLWWLYNVMMEGNRHFEHNWRWEDSLAAAVQSQLGVTPPTAVPSLPTAPEPTISTTPEPAPPNESPTPAPEPEPESPAAPPPFTPPDSPDS